MSRDVFETYKNGNVDCSHRNLISLEDALKEIGADFYCDKNQLTSLNGAPKEVGGYFSCSCNHLTSLEGAPKEFGIETQVPAKSLKILSLVILI